MRRLALVLAVTACGQSAGNSPDASTTDGRSGDSASRADAPPGDAVTGQFTDGVCTPGALSTGMLDEDCIYLLGTLLPGSSGHDVLINLAAPDAYSWGFGNYAALPTIRHNDGHLLFSDDNGESRVFAWTPDAAPTGNPQPNAMLANDLVIATPACALGAWRALAFPDDGVAAYRCYRDAADPPADANRLFLENQSTVFLAGGEFSTLALGPGRSVLLANETTLGISVNGTTPTPVDVGAFGSVIASRWAGDGFLAALYRTGGMIELEHITTTGQVASRGTFQLGTVMSYYDQCQIDRDATLVCFAETGTTDLVVRFSTSAAPVTIFDESAHSVQIHISSLATGA